MISGLVKELNEVLKYGLALIYGVGIPIICAGLYLLFFVKPPLLFRVALASLLFNVSAAMFGSNFVCGGVSAAAHKPYIYLNSIFGRMKGTSRKLKLLNLIERLAGPKIALYCLDLFPLTNKEFFEVRNYFKK